MTQTTVSRKRGYSEFREDYNFDRDVKNLISRVDDRYDDWVREWKLWPSANAGDKSIMSYQKNFYLTSLFGNKYTGPTKPATDKLQGVYEHLNSYLQDMGVTGMQFQLLLIYQSQHTIRGFDLFLHFIEDTKKSELATFILYSMQYLIADRYNTVTTQPRTLILAYEDIPDEKESPDN